MSQTLHLNGVVDRNTTPWSWNLSMRLFCL